jgi:glycosyltransferase involved in cell wall biosynthesis
MEQKTVVIIGPAHPLRGGLATFDERLATEFNRQGYKAIIYTFSLQYPGFLFPGTTQYSNDPPPENLDIRIRINSVNPINWIRVGNELKKLKPALIVVRYWLPFMGPCLGTILRRVRKNQTTKIVCIADNVLPHEKRLGDKPFTRYFIKPVDGFVTMSEKVREDLKLFNKQKPVLTVTHPLYDNFGEKLPITEARKHLGLPENIPIIIFFGFIRKYKGLDLLLDAMKLLKEDDHAILKELKLLVAGEFYEKEQPYLDQITQNGITDNVILRTQFIADSEVKYYLSAADLLVQPYKNATQSGVTPLAYHFLVPMVVTNVGGLPAMVPDGIAGLVAEPNPESIARKIKEMVINGPGKYVPAMLEERKKYSWDKLTSAIVNLTHDIQK